MWEQQYIFIRGGKNYFYSFIFKTSKDLDKGKKQSDM